MSIFTKKKRKNKKQRIALSVKLSRNMIKVMTDKNSIVQT